MQGLLHSLFRGSTVHRNLSLFTVVGGREVCPIVNKTWPNQYNYLMAKAMPIPTAKTHAAGKGSITPRLYYTMAPIVRIEPTILHSQSGVAQIHILVVD